MASKLSEKLCFAWSGDYESLKQFVKDDLNLEGTWSQPGGDRKLFAVDDSTILWKKNKCLLCLDGARANEFMRKLCGLICSLKEPMLDARRSSMQLPVARETLEDLQQGQLVNSEAIQALSGTITHIASVMSQFQSFMDKNNCDQSNTTSVESSNTASEEFEYGNQEINCDTNKESIEKPIASNELNDSSTVQNTLIGPNENGRLKSINNTTNAEQNFTQGYKKTFANIVSSHEADTNNHKSNSEKPLCKAKEPSSDPDGKAKEPSKPKNRKAKEPSSDPDGFIGVERKRRKTKKFYLTGIAQNVNENQIFTYLNKKNIIPTYISIFPSRRRGTLSSKIHVPSADSSLVQEDNFWPKFVACKPWRPKDNTKNPVEREMNLTHEGIFSTYV